MISTLGGLFNLNHFDQSSCANDVIVIRHKDGSLHSTPFNVRFGRAQMWSYIGRVVQVEVNGELTAAVMKIGKGGEAYWLQPTYGTFGNSCHGAVAATSSAAAEGGVPPAAAALAGASGVSTTLKNEEEGQIVMNGFSLPVQEGETLAMNEAELRHFPIASESLPRLPPSSEADDGDWGECKDSAGFQAPPPVPAPLPSQPGSTVAAPASMEANSGHLPLSEAGQHRRPGDRGPSCEDSAPCLPLLHTADDGHLTIETRAIYSAGDAQEARLALRAMAAAEKSRKRLRKMGLGDDPYLLKAALEEGHAGEDGDDDDGGGDDNVVEGNRSVLGDGEGESGAHRPEKPAVEIVVDSADMPSTSHEAAVAAADGCQTEQASFAATLTTVVIKSDAESTGHLLVPPTTNRGDGELSDTAQAPSTTQPPAEAATVASSATSVAGSIDSYKVEDGDPYFLDPLDTDGDYAALYGEEESALLNVASFPSSVTSGVSLNDLVLAPGTNAGDAAAALRGPASADEGEPRSGTEFNPTMSSSAVPLLVPSTAGGATGSTRSLPSPPLTGETQAHGSTTDVGKVVAPLLSPGVIVSTGKSSATPTGDLKAAEVMDAHRQPVMPRPNRGGVPGGSYFTRTLIPVEADLWKLHLKEGCNTVRYLARKGNGDVASISCNIFLWNWTDRLVVSDVDGTITKSDLLGHFYAMLGKGADWTHPGICNLYSKIERNGYRMVYLTARSVSQIKQTKSYLFTLQQDGVRLPMGPVLTAPQRFFTALTQEVSKQSHVFKIACLTSVRAAFPPTTKPFFAGFGNRYNDVISYDAAGISMQRIFIIDPSSVLHVCLVRQTYRDLGHLVDVTFPPVKRHPIVLRGPRHLQRAQGTGATPSLDGATAAEGRERCSYARSLLHRSTPALSFSVSSVSTAVSSASDSSDGCGAPRGPGTDFGADGAATVFPYGDGHDPLHHHHSAPHHHTAVGLGPTSDDDGRVSHRASAAFSLVSSVRLDILNQRALSDVAASPGEPPEPVDGGGSTPTTPIPGAVSKLSAPAFPNTSSSVAPCTGESAAAQPATSLAPSAPPTGKPSNRTPIAHSHWYNYGLCPTSAELADSTPVILEEEEEVPVDPDYSSFAFWRIDPRDLITIPSTMSKSSAAAATSLLNRGLPDQGKCGVAVNGIGAPKKAAAIATAATASTEQKDHQNAAAAASPTVPKGGAVGDAVQPGAACSRSVSAAASPKRGSAAVCVSGADNASAPTSDGGDCGSSSKLSPPVQDCDSRALMEGSTKSLNKSLMRSSVSDTGAGSPRTGFDIREPQLQTLRKLENREVGDVGPYHDCEGTAATNVKAGGGSPRRQQSFTLPSTTQPPALVPSTSGGGGGGGSRGFFSAFSFGRSRTVKSSLSPTSQRATQLLEEAKQRALAHPDARNYNAAPLPSHEGTSSLESTKCGAATPLGKDAE
ncbi:hypothetical protein JKF63_07151 [Porcisia hertigi]|uniref:LNS2/PITP domain-containing protein n=1 Tax=Porcisia hertigi TaxID=2761500 RepID=A0A836LKF3_9TRYP|nr:hypothetical protein JKF63_07151 [Porcisia hertigi]